jgi:molybdenum cofactor guanylyltransferase
LSDQALLGAIVLAGGDSKRLGQPKPMLELDGVTLLKWSVVRLSAVFKQITVVTDRPEFAAGLPVKVTGDLLTGCPKSPLRGIHAGLNISSLPYQFVTACDMPFINTALIKYMAGLTCGHDVVVPRVKDYYQPLYAFYSRSCLEPIRRRVEAGEGKVTGFYDGLKIRYVSFEEISRFDPRQESFFNINTWEDYRKAQSKA